MGLSPPDAKSSRILIVYCVLSTLFCFRFIHLAKLNSLGCQNPFTTLAGNATETSNEFPRKIWQTSKISPASLEEKDRKAIQSWMKMNQKHRYEIVTQYSAESYVRDRFLHRPDIQETFFDLQDPILRADFFRYLVLLGDGGIYSDIDTLSLKPVEDWVPPAFKDKANLVVGIEYDSLGREPWSDFPMEFQFATWAMMAKPGHLMMEITVDRVLDRLRKLAQKQEKTISGIKPSFREVMDTTGPALFTEAVFEGLSFTTGTKFSHLNVTGLTSAQLVGDVLILPINAFGSGQVHSNSGSPDEDSALVQHLFKGSWKADHIFNNVKPEDKSEPES